MIFRLIHGCNDLMQPFRDRVDFRRKVYERGAALDHECLVHDRLEGTTKSLASVLN